MRNRCAGAWDGRPYDQIDRLMPLEFAWRGDWKHVHRTPPHKKAAAIDLQQGQIDFFWVCDDWAPKIWISSCRTSFPFDASSGCTRENDVFDLGKSRKIKIKEQFHEWLSVRTYCEFWFCYHIEHCDSNWTLDQPKFDFLPVDPGESSLCILFDRDSRRQLISQGLGSGSNNIENGPPLITPENPRRRNALLRWCSSMVSLKLRSIFWMQSAMSRTVFMTNWYRRRLLTRSGREKSEIWTVCGPHRAHVINWTPFSLTSESRCAQMERREWLMNHTAGWSANPSFLRVSSRNRGNALMILFRNPLNPP